MVLIASSSHWSIQGAEIFHLSPPEDPKARITIAVRYNLPVISKSYSILDSSKTWRISWARVAFLWLESSLWDTPHLAGKRIVTSLWAAKYRIELLELKTPKGAAWLSESMASASPFWEGA
jgi:hypothetical protein